MTRAASFVMCEDGVDEAVVDECRAFLHAVRRWHLREEG